MLRHAFRREAPSGPWYSLLLFDASMSVVKARPEGSEADRDHGCRQRREQAEQRRKPREAPDCVDVGADLDCGLAALGLPRRGGVWDRSPRLCKQQHHPPPCTAALENSATAEC